jgi:hypothetical protein
MNIANCKPRCTTIYSNKKEGSKMVYLISKFLGPKVALVVILLAQFAHHAATPAPAPQKQAQKAPTFNSWNK